MKTNKKEILTQALMAIAVVATVGMLRNTWVVMADDDDDEGDDHHERSSRRELTPLVSASGQPTTQAVGALVVGLTKWKSECSSCHQLYHPGLLPERSWRKMMGSLQSHFGESAALDDLTKNEITSFLVSQSADHSTARRSSKIASAIPTSETPLRFSDSYYFKRKHHEVSADVFKRPKVGSAANCLACHAGAESGVYSEHQVKIPGPGPVPVATTPPKKGK